MVMFFFKE